MARAHYIVRVGNVGIAPKVSSKTPNHWYYLSPQHLWGLPRDMAHVNVRADFEADIENAQVTTYIWFLCNSYGGPGHFVQVGIGQRHLGNGPVGSGNLPIPADMVSRLQQGFDHWFNWRPVSTNADFERRVRELPIPHPPFIPTLRRVTGDHPSFPAFQGLIDVEEQAQQAFQPPHQQAPVAPPPPPPPAQALSPAPTTPSLTHSPFPPPPPHPPHPPHPPPQTIEEADLENIRREHSNPHSQGYIYLIRMAATSFYKIGMSLDPLARLRTLQTGNPHPLHLLTTQEVSDMRSVEMELHRRYENQRVPNVNVREWFFLEEEEEEEAVKKVFAGFM